MSGRQGWSRWQPDSLLTWRDGRAGTGDDYWRETRHCAVLARWEARQSSWSLLGGRAGDSDVQWRPGHDDWGGAVGQVWDWGAAGGHVLDWGGGQQMVMSGTGGFSIKVSVRKIKFESSIDVKDTAENRLTASSFEPVEAALEPASPVRPASPAPSTSVSPSAGSSQVVQVFTTPVSRPRSAAASPTMHLNPS